MTSELKLVECPRDAMQGISQFIPTEQKVEYLNALLRVGFHTIDFGSFVSPKAIPQMADTAEVLSALDLSDTRSALLAIIANIRGAEDASRHSAIRYLGFPLSISETFQKRNTNKSIAEALEMLKEIKEICTGTGKELVVYISMGFGNPYGDPYDARIVGDYVGQLIAEDIDIISLADTVGVARSEEVESLFTAISRQYPDAEIGVHLHARPETAVEKIAAAWRGGCRRFDGALRGFGGCPMADDELVGNIPTETIVRFFRDRDISLDLDEEALAHAMKVGDRVLGVRS